MPNYKTTVNFWKDYSITAKDAKDANYQLEELVGDDEFSVGLQNDGFEIFEDEPVECQKCKGAGTIGEDYQNCDECKGEGSVPFKANTELRHGATNQEHEH
jgi:RecJ-like exonuclease